VEEREKKLLQHKKEKYKLFSLRKYLFRKKHCTNVKIKNTYSTNKKMFDTKRPTLNDIILSSSLKFIF
jgi:hypothetical protein